MSIQRAWSQLLVGIVLLNGKLTPVVITTGITNGTSTEVLSGLQAGDQVVTSATGGPFSNLSGSTGVALVAAALAVEAEAAETVASGE